MPETTRPQDFDPVFSQGVVIVGGHAVNLWASFYADRGDAVLARFAPFTSKDADIFVKDRDLAVAIATAAGWQFRSNPEPRSPVRARRDRDDERKTSEHEAEDGGEHQPFGQHLFRVAVHRLHPKVVGDLPPVHFLCFGEREAAQLIIDELGATD